MGPLKQVEDGLEGIFKSFPPMPENGKKWLVRYWPILALVFGVLQVLAFFSLWQSGHRVDEAINAINAYSRALNGKSVSSSLGLTYWLSLISLIVSGVLLLLAYPGLKAHKKAGWDWLFLGTVINLVYGVLAAFTSYGGAGKLFGAVIGSAISFYLLFQVKSYYSKGVSSTK